MMVPNTVIKRRLVILLLFSLLLSFALMFRDFWIQFVKSEELKGKRHKSNGQEEMCPWNQKGVRFTIRNKKPLAIKCNCRYSNGKPARH